MASGDKIRPKDLTRKGKVVDNRPLTLNDACWHESDGASRLRSFKHSEVFSPKMTYIQRINPTREAGAPLSNDIVTCQR